MTSDLEKQKEPIQGKVAGILTERELAINIGTSGGVQVGMKFRVLADEPSEVRDPETNDLLGFVDREKVRVQAAQVHEKFSICKTYRTHIVGGSMYFGSLSGMFAPPREISETLKAKGSAYLPPLPEEESYVQKGDRVVQLLEHKHD